MTFAELAPEQLLLKCVSGSRAYNLALPASDTDIKGVFVLPRDEFYGLTYTQQVNNATNDEVFFEIGRLVELLCKNNPNVLELLSTPPSCLLYRHPLMELLDPADFLSKLCLDTFAGYAKTQIKKARGLNKKINRSFDRERKPVLEFCYIVGASGSTPLSQWLAAAGLRQEDCGLAAVAHSRDAYLLFSEASLRGIVSGPDANDVQLSSIPKGLASLAVMHFNKDAYSIYCKEYAEYWTWVENRNEERYASTMAHGQSYDAKHMMHTFRLLSMAEEIARYRRVIVHREDREFLLRIRSGAFGFEELLDMVSEKMERVAEAYAASELPESPDVGKAEKLLIRIRSSFYL